jgi:hypothetical protein
LSEDVEQQPLGEAQEPPRPAGRGRPSGDRKKRATAGAPASAGTSPSGKKKGARKASECIRIADDEKASLSSKFKSIANSASELEILSGYAVTTD